MTKTILLKKNIYTIITFLFCFSLFAQLPNPAIVGYWENWKGERFIPLKDIDSRYNVINIAFATPKKGSDYDIELVLPYSYTEVIYKNEIKGLQDKGKKVIISIGGQNHHVLLNTVAEKDTFVSSVNAMIDKWGFDGVDIDLEGASLKFTEINIQSPGDDKQKFLIAAIQDILANHKAKHGKKLILTMAPETIYVQSALSQWAGDYRGAYLPIIEALKDDIDMLNVQLYNTGSMFGLDGASGGEFKQSTADFLVAMTEAVIKGFKATGKIGTFSGLSASQVGIGLPGCEGWGYTSPKDIEAAIKYLTGKGPQPGSYKLKQDGGYPELRGMMVWSINSDKNCTPSYGYIHTWESLFSTEPHIRIQNKDEIFEQKETDKIFEVHLKNDNFISSINKDKWTIKNLPLNVSVNKIDRINDTTVHVTLTGKSSEVYKTYIRNVSVKIDSAEFEKGKNSLTVDRGVILKKNPLIIPGLFEAEAYDIQNRYKMNGVNDIKTLNTENVNYTNSFNYLLEYKVDVTTTDTYNAIIKIKTKNSGDFSFYVDGEIMTTLKVQSTNNEWKMLSTEGIKLSESTHTLRITTKKGLFYLDNIEFKKFVSNSTIDLFGTKQGLFYPNPVKNKIYFNNIIDGEISIYTLRGDNIIPETPIKEGDNINISSLQKGIYFIKFTASNGNIIYQKFIKE